MIARYRQGKLWEVSNGGVVRREGDGTFLRWVAGCACLASNKGRQNPRDMRQTVKSEGHFGQ